ncbi:MAG: hypothetical protein RMJ98_09705 [Myxococcales bacterium]|nr:hypothetical protein [Polyangiaceae bacterium]MDW8249563.1 hypothetical protein [Myxococcales bacterium]
MGRGAAVGRGIAMLLENVNAPIPTKHVRIDNNLILGNGNLHRGVEFQHCSSTVRRGSSLASRATGSSTSGAGPSALAILYPTHALGTRP